MVAEAYGEPGLLEKANLKDKYDYDLIFRFDGKCGVLNPDRGLIVPPEYDSIEHRDSFFRAWKAGRVFQMDHQGKIEREILKPGE